MDYTKFPNAQSSNAQPDPGNKVSPKDFYGSGAVGGQTGISFGGTTGVTITGTQGIWAGAQEQAAAPFSVDLQGRLKASLITINDSNGNAVIDSSGIVSSTQFRYGILTVNSGGNTTTTDFSASVPSLTIAVDLPREANVYMFATVGLYNDEAYTGDLCLSQLAVDGIRTGPILYAAGTPWAASHATIPAAGSVTPSGITLVATSLLTAGSHTVSVRFASQNGNNAGVGVSNNTIGYIVLGK